ncbi:hypothetical protein EV421DRAFT_2039522 [Armillaria borealis]|uniref:Uncharacterized protein n=1 Tax=Armillaria borealis TaxID=47425 RepID=A0AA39J595_9AGAR|nr:hypothetical protein EV421DRAFT_2039522 [Armillaria borealis]
MTTLPPELVEIIDMHITNLAFLDYLYNIARFQEFIIYHDFIPRFTRTITCFFDLPENARDRAAKGVYRYLIALPNIQALFPLVPFISSQLVCIGIDQDPFFPPFHGIPILARYDRFLYNDSPHRSELCAWKNANACIYFHGRPGSFGEYVPPDLALYAVLDAQSWCFFDIILVPPGSYDILAIDDVRHLRQSTYITERRLKDWGLKNINTHLWMASNKRRTLALRCLTGLSYRWEYTYVQLSLPFPFSWKRYDMSLFDSPA